MSAVKYSEPVTVDEAVSILTSEKESKCLAGGASLVAMMNARLVEPSMLVSLRGISELNVIDQGIDGSVRIGAGVHHYEIAAAGQLVAGHAVVKQAAAVIANPVIRSMGTLGGLVAHCDPAADVLAALVALDAEIEIAGKKSRRKMPASNFFIDWYTTALEPGELITAVYLPPPPAG
ncbi:MAG: FAD binding domain-containing protein, partial [SAR324 cluster bacterium]|nr:FAD binding domain-containing protein [SAR324 cluster bacterium]